MKTLFLVLVAMLTLGCEQQPFISEKSPFSVYSSSDRNILVIVNGTKRINLGPNSNFDFDVTIDFQRPSNDYGSGPSPINQTVRVPVVVEDAWTKTRIEPFYCSAKINVRSIINITKTSATCSTY